jgi:hypothetical protein
MLKHEKMHRLILSALAVMLVASFLLAAASFAALPSAQAAPPQPLTYCWDYIKLTMCDCGTHQYWEYWCHRCCNDPDYCPTGCCDIYC